MSETCFNCDLPYQPFRIKVPNGHLSHCPYCDFELSHALTNLLVVDEAYEFQKMQNRYYLPINALFLIKPMIADSGLN